MRDAEVESIHPNGDGEVRTHSEEAETCCGQQGEILHGLNNVLVSIVLNAQLIAWKLPTYSRLRRNVHEIERGAQRAGVLLKRLLAEKRLREDPANSDLYRGQTESLACPRLKTLGMNDSLKCSSEGNLKEGGATGRS